MNEVVQRRVYSGGFSSYGTVRTDFAGEGCGKDRKNNTNQKGVPGTVMDLNIDKGKFNRRRL